MREVYSEGGGTPALLAVYQDYTGMAKENALSYAFAADFRLSHIAVSLDEVRPVLETFITGLSGRTLKLESGNAVFTSKTSPKNPIVIKRELTTGSVRNRTIRSAQLTRGVTIDAPDRS